ALEGVARALARLGPHALAVAESSEEVRERAARVGQADLELRVAIEDPAEDEVRGRDRRVERIPEEVVQIEGLEALGTDDRDRVQQHREPQRFQAREDR